MSQKPLCDTAKWQRLVAIMEQLRAPGGCPWDRAQDHQSLKRYFLEETYEVLDAIDSGDDRALCDELGDALLQVVFHAQIAREAGRFTIDDVLDQVNAKMVRRHPHIFGSGEAETPEAVLSLWEQIKAKEREGLPEGSGSRGLMKVNDNLPALLMAQKVQDKAARVGFDWPDISGPEEKLREELAEFQAAATTEEKLDELGDVLFALVNVARFKELDAEDALRHTVKKFISRFNYIEEQMEARGSQWGEISLAEMDGYWNQAKAKGL